MTATTKTVAYTQEMAAEMTSAYEAAPTVETIETLAVKFSKSTKSIVAKLAQLGIYKSAKAVAKASAKAETKADIAARVAGEDAEFAKDLEKLTKASLVKVAQRFAAEAADVA